MAVREKGELKEREFNVVATLMQSKEPAREAARLVLVEARPPSAAAREAGVLPQSVSRLLRRCREVHEFILTGYAKKK